MNPSDDAALTTTRHIDEVDPRYLIRERREEDFAPLGNLLMAQQPLAKYPLRDPLPVPIRQFLHGEDATAAWTITAGGQPIGHGCHVTQLPRGALTEGLETACAQAHRCTADQLAWVASLFVSLDHGRRGLGTLLLDTVVNDIRSRGLRPCLEVYPGNIAPTEMYRNAGWRTVHQIRPAWLTDALGDEGPDVLVMVLDS